MKFVVYRDSYENVLSFFFVNLFTLYTRVYACIIYKCTKYIILCQEWCIVNMNVKEENSMTLSLVDCLLNKVMIRKTKSGTVKDRCGF